MATNASNENESALTIEGKAAAKTGRGQRLRKRAGLSQRDIAEMVGVSQPTILRWESGHPPASIELAIAYARVLRRIAVEVSIDG